MKMHDTVRADLPDYLQKRKRLVDNMERIEVVAAIIKHQNKIFATQRGYGDFMGGWEFPGGKLEAGETPQQALVREIREELDTEIEVGELIETVEYDYPQFHLTMHCFMCTVKSGNLVLKEHNDSRWLTKETLDSVDWLPADKGLIHKIKCVC
jgi:8-oxo-dGTP diphosphatase